MENLIKEWRTTCGYTQRQAVARLQQVCPGLDAALLSKIEHGLCEPSSPVREYALKELASRNVEILSESQGNMPLQKNDAEIGDFGLVMRELRKADKFRPVTKEYLCVLLHKNDREVRDMIKQMRDRGVRIASSSGSKGYWLAKTEREYNNLRGELIGRAKALLTTVARMDASTEGQEVMNLNGSA